MVCRLLLGLLLLCWCENLQSGLKTKQMKKITHFPRLKEKLLEGHSIWDTDPSEVLGTECCSKDDG